MKYQLTLSRNELKLIDKLVVDEIVNTHDDSLFILREKLMYAKKVK